MVKYISDRIIVMYVGNMMELVDNGELYKHLLYSYTKSLLSITPLPDTSMKVSKNE